MCMISIPSMSFHIRYIQKPLAKQDIKYFHHPRKISHNPFLPILTLPY